MDRIWDKARSTISGNQFYIVILAVIFVGALLLRILGEYDNIFLDGEVRFASTDPWVHVRLIENTIHHLPFRIDFDPAALFPNGQNVGVAPFFDVFLAVIIWVIGLGSPSQHLIETACAYAPAILGALTIIPAYIIGKEVFNKKAGLLAAALLAVLPGEFLGRSLLGHTDHHAAEVFFSVLTVLFMILALKSARKNELSFEHFLKRDWKSIRKPLIYALLAGLMLGIYLLTWIGGLLLILILFAYLVLQFIIDHCRGRSTDYLCIIGVPSFFLALLMVIPVSPNFYISNGKTYLIASLLAGILVFLVLSGASRLMNYIWAKRYYYPLALAALALVAFLFLHFLGPSWVSSMEDRLFDVLHPSGAEETTQEARSIFLLDSSYEENIFSWRHLWNNFGTTFFLAFVALFAVVYAALKERSAKITFLIVWSAIMLVAFIISWADPDLTIWSIAFIALLAVAFAAFKERSAEKTLLIVWSVVVLLATIGQIRFSYYLAVNVALLTGFLCWEIVGKIRNVGFRELLPPGKLSTKAQDIRGRPLPSGRLTKKERKRLRREEKRKREEKRYATGMGMFMRSNRSARYVLAILFLIWLVLFPGFAMTFEGGSWPWPNLDKAAGWDDSLIGRAVQYATYDPRAAGGGGVNDDWYEALVWLGDNTPQPYPDDFYYELYQRPAKGQQYEYPDPEAAYGVISWWDYGHWIMHIARRIPNANPSAKPGIVGQFFVAQNETEGAEILNKLGSEYVIIDVEMATGKFYAMAHFAKRDPAEFFDYYYDPSTGEGHLLFHEEYYRSMCSRLFNFKGEEVIPENSTLVISYQVQTIEGVEYNILTDSKTFPTYDEDEIEAYIGNQTSAHPTWECRVVGVDRFISPVGLEKLEHYNLVHKSPTTVVQRGEETLAYVEIFEYLPE